MPSEKIQRVYPAASGALWRLEVMLGWPRQGDLLRVFQVKNNSKSDRLPKKRESSLEDNANTILRIYSKKRSYSVLALDIANYSFSDFFFFFFLRQGRMCLSPELPLEEKLEGGSNSQTVFLKWVSG